MFVNSRNLGQPCAICVARTRRRSSWCSTSRHGSRRCPAGRPPRNSRGQLAGRTCTGGRVIHPLCSVHVITLDDRPLPGKNGSTALGNSRTTLDCRKSPASSREARAPAGPAPAKIRSHSAYHQSIHSHSRVSSTVNHTIPVAYRKAERDPA